MRRTSGAEGRDVGGGGTDADAAAADSSAAAVDNVVEAVVSGVQSPSASPFKSAGSWHGNAAGENEANVHAVRLAAKMVT